MPNFIFAYHGGTKPEDETEIEKSMNGWRDWMKNILGDSIVDAGNPVGLSKTLNQSGVENNGGSNPLSGYTIIKADNMEQALEMGRGCPIMGEGGSIEVAEIIELEM